MKKQKVRTLILSVFRDKPRNDEANCIEHVNDSPTINVCEDQLPFKDQIAFIDSCASNAMAILRVPSGMPAQSVTAWTNTSTRLPSMGLPSESSLLETLETGRTFYSPAMFQET